MNKTNIRRYSKQPQRAALLMQRSPPYARTGTIVINMLNIIIPLKPQILHTTRAITGANKVSLFTQSDSSGSNNKKGMLHSNASIRCAHTQEYIPTSLKLIRIILTTKKPKQPTRMPRLKLDLTRKSRLQQHHFRTTHRLSPSK